MSDNLETGTEEELVEDTLGATETESEGGTLQADSIGDDPSATTGDEDEALSTDEVYYDFEGEEVSLSEIKEWKSGALRQADYTKKTQAAASDRKVIEEQKLALTQKTSLLADIESGLEKLVMGDLSGAYGVRPYISHSAEGAE